MLASRTVGHQPLLLGHVEAGLEQLGVRAHVRSATPHSAGKAPASLPVAVEVHHRESVLGCHSFERFLDARFETLFVFEAKLASLWRLEALVRRVTHQQSIAAHLLTLDQPSGEATARVVALAALGTRAPPLLLSAQCDIHVLPEWHAYHLPFSSVVQRLVAAFQWDALARNSSGGSRADHWGKGELLQYANRASRMSAQCVGRLSGRRRALLALAPVFVESLPNASNYDGSQMHSFDVTRWVRRRWKYRMHPAEAAVADPWLADMSLWPDEHLLLFDAQLLRGALKATKALGDAQIDTFPRIVPALLCEQGMAVMRHQQIVLFYDLGGGVPLSPAGVQARSGQGADPGHSHASGAPLHPTSWRADTGHLHASGAPLQPLLRYNFRLLASRCNPLSCALEARLAKMALRVTPGLWCGDGALHLRELPELPSRQLHGRHQNHPPLRHVLDSHVVPLLRMAGYVEVSRSASEVAFLALPLMHTRLLIEGQEALSAEVRLQDGRCGRSPMAPHLMAEAPKPCLVLSSSQAAAQPELVRRFYAALRFLGNIPCSARKKPKGLAQLVQHVHIISLPLDTVRVERVGSPLKGTGDWGRFVEGKHVARLNDELCELATVLRDATWSSEDKTKQTPARWTAEAYGSHPRGTATDSSSWPMQNISAKINATLEVLLRTVSEALPSEKQHPRVLLARAMDPFLSSCSTRA